MASRPQATTSDRSSTSKKETIQKPSNVLRRSKTPDVSDRSTYKCADKASTELDHRLHIFQVQDESLEELTMTNPQFQANTRNDEMDVHAVLSSTRRTNTTFQMQVPHASKIYTPLVQEENNNKNAEIQRLKDEKSNLNIEIKRLQEENDKISGDMKDLQTIIIVLQEDIIHLAELQNETRYERYESDKFKTIYEKKQIQQQNDNMSNKMKELQQQNDNMRNEMKQLRQQNDDLGNEMQQLYQQNDNMSDEKKELQKQNDNVSNEMQQLQQQNDNMSTEMQQLQQQKNTMSNEMKQLQQENNSISNEMRQLQQENSNINNEIQKLREDNNIITESGSVKILSEELGRGAYATVYAGEFYGTKVAVKEFHEIIMSPYNIDILQREINIASKCRHPNLLQFLCATRNDKERLLIVTELMDTSLRKLIEQRASAKSRLEHEEVKMISLDVARGLNFLHSKTPSPIIHRDVSSANVLLWIGNGGVARAKISDYGSANFTQACNTANPGAMLYAAPEANQAKQDSKIDVYSYGILVCEMCILKLPDPTDRKNQRKEISKAAIRRLVENCTQEKPEKRPTMQEVIGSWQRIKTQDLHRISPMLGSWFRRL